MRRKLVIKLFNHCNHINVYWTTVIQIWSAMAISLCCLTFRGNIAAVGYLLFAIWLSLHASVAAHAIGVEFLLDRILAHFTSIASEWGKRGTEVAR